MKKKNIKLLIIGCGGHGKVVLDSAISMDCWSEIAFIDDKYPNLKEFNSIKVLSKIKNIKKFENNWTHIIVAIGNNKLRTKITNLVGKRKFILTNVIDSSAKLSSNIKIGKGNVIFANSIIASGSKIMNNSIINHGAIIDHDCKIGSNTHICANVSLSGNIKIGNNVFIGTNSSIINESKIGNNVVIGSCSLVNKSISNSKVGFGIPFEISKK